ncbi:SAM-dependent methyltransferase [Streptosporangium soli]|nr:SAM-dependent methyltransferase [Streptosporangium sp. KLBMP 9127]
MVMGPAPRGIDPSIPSTARIYDHLLGGKDNFAADRTAAERILEIMPEARLLARQNRAFLHRAVRYCAEQGIDQFIDIGTGIPTQGNTHEIAQSVNAGARVAYVDNDPIVTAHSRALLEREGSVVTVEADACKPAEILGSPLLRELIDLSRPFAVLFVAILHFVPGAHEAVRPMRDALPSGGMFVLTHGVRNTRTGDDEAAELQAVYSRATSPAVDRSAAEVLALFGGLPLVEPGLVAAWDWRPDDTPSLEVPTGGGVLAGVARRP